MWSSREQQETEFRNSFNLYDRLKGFIKVIRIKIMQPETFTAAKRYDNIVNRHQKKKKETPSPPLRRSSLPLSNYVSLEIQIFCRAVIRQCQVTREMHNSRFLGHHLTLSLEILDFLVMIKGAVNVL